MESVISKEQATGVKKSGVWKRIKASYQLYLFLFPAVVLYLVFKYYPMYGIQIAFRNFTPSKGIWGSDWVGIDNFVRFFKAYNFWQIIENTVSLQVLTLLFGFPMPILIALMLNQLNGRRYKKFVQTVIYAPNFISMVVLVGMLIVFLSPTSGIVNHLIVLLGGKPIQFMSDPQWFRPLYILSGIWQETGFGTIIYLAALAGINPELHEAATMDGASKWRRILHVDIPGIMPTIIILLIFTLGNIMNVGFEKAFLMQNDLNYSASNIIPTYVYTQGIQKAQYSYSAAVGLFNTLINIVLLLAVNRIAKKATGTSLF
ncbi:ABC transporter permease [Paenibacillus oleatilyticus]|uniref:ABC transporter permease n=1 Tax=Paenibacillus oleatilyticus TaxID=2594886 RepID=UPI001C1FF5AC|nr:ABC transporter permease subunit [Paenibacillus oleatilyticus]MBU7316627.1 ABC transporter permease subunit [Paenibacillus oleatilyticus]